MAKLTNEELIRYSRHLVLDEFGVDAQLKLKQARALIVGAGGLGSPVLLYLAAAGLGTLGIADNDDVSLSNLQRQVIFTINDIGNNKASAAAERLTLLNPNINCIIHPVKLTSDNALDVIGNYDVVIDCTDNFPSRYLLNDACVLSGKSLIYGSILKFEGHIAVFNYQRADGLFSANYRDVFPSPPSSGSTPNCEQAGVLGVLPGMIGSMQANEAIKIVTGVGEPLADTLVIVDALTLSTTRVKLSNRQARNTIKNLIDYEYFCSDNEDKNKPLTTEIKILMKEVSVQELKALKDSGADFQLIDVREPHENDICEIGGELIPMNDIPNNVDKISKDKQVIIHCRSGKRSGDTIAWLEKTHGFENLYNLKGGILAWANEIDDDMPTY